MVLKTDRIDAEAAAQYALRYLERRVESFGLDLAQYRGHMAARPDLPPADVVWGMCNEELIRLTKTRDWQGAGALYYGMALFAAEEDRAFIHLLEASAKMRLHGYQSQGAIRKVRILTAGKGNACESCRRLERKTFTLEEALQLEPLPCKSCTMVVVGTTPGFCRCEYIPCIR